MAPPHQKKARVACKWRDDLALSHGLQKPTHGISNCAFCISFGREARVSESGLQNKQKRKPTIRPLAFSDFSRSRIAEHYVASHPAKWSEYQQRLEAKWRSAETNTEFFDVNKLTSHFRRVQDSSVKKKVNRDGGDLIKSLYEKDEEYAADDPDVRSVTILENYDSDSDSDEGSGDEDHQGYVAYLGSEATYLHVVELVKAGLSYR
jgi:hypothetical protein